MYYTMNSGDRVFNFSFYRYQLMMGLFEIPGVLLVIFLMDIIGRRATSITGMMFCALALILLQGFSGWFFELGKNPLISKFRLNFLFLRISSNYTRNPG